MSDDYIIIDDPERLDVCFRCGAINGRTTLSACENFCNKHTGCYTVAEANDVLVEYESKNS